MSTTTATATAGTRAAADPTSPRPRLPEPPGHDLAPRARQRRVLAQFMAVACAEHDVPRGEPCWTLDPAYAATVVVAHLAVCGARMDRARRAEEVGREHRLAYREGRPAEITRGAVAR